MPVDTWMIYVGAVFALMITPGPSQLLMLSVASTNGFRRSIFTAAGDLSANVLQMAAAGFGLAAVIAGSASVLGVIQILGVIYLAWLGIRMIRKAAQGDAMVPSEPSAGPGALWLRGFIGSAVNPKAVIFFAALFPQFIDADLPILPQMLALSLTYLVMDGCFLGAYGLSADWLARRVQGPARVWVDRIGGGFMIGAAVLLGLRGVSS